MQKELFKTIERIPASALFLGQRIDLRKIGQIEPEATSPLVIAAGPQGLVALFRYGVIVCFGMQPAEILRVVEGFRGLISEPFEQPEREELELFIDRAQPEGLEQDRVCLHDFNLQKLQEVADVLAKSTVLAHYESRLTESFDRIEPLAESLRRGSHGGPKGTDLLKHVGDALAIEAKMTGRIEMTEKPELIWDYPQYDRLDLRLRDEFDLFERHAAIDRKLGLISRTAQTLLDLVHNERSLRVEWYIVILIIADIVIAFAEKLF